MAELQPMYKLEDYLVANSPDEVRQLTKSGYDIHGSASFDGGVMYQPMIKQRLLTTEEYASFVGDMQSILEQLEKMF